MDTRDYLILLVVFGLGAVLGYVYGLSETLALIELVDAKPASMLW